MAGELRHTDGETVSECSILATLRTRAPAPATHPHYCTPVLHSTGHSTVPGHRTSNHQSLQNAFIKLFQEYPTALNIDPWTVVKLSSSWICFCYSLRKETIRVPFVVGISFSNNWDTWAGINQCVVVTIWQRTIEDRDPDSGCQQPLLARAGHGDAWRGARALTLSLSLTLTSRGREHNCLF